MDADSQERRGRVGAPVVGVTAVTAVTHAARVVTGRYGTRLRRKA